MSELVDEHDLGHSKLAPTGKQLLNIFLESRRRGNSAHTILYYQRYLARFIINYELTPEGINTFLTNLDCNAGGKFAYYRAIRALCNWLFRNDYLIEINTSPVIIRHDPMTRPFPTGSLNSNVPSTTPTTIPTSLADAI